MERVDKEGQIATAKVLIMMIKVNVYISKTISISQLTKQEIHSMLI